MLNEFLFTKIEKEDIGNIWFQQDGATQPNIDILRRNYTWCFAPCFWRLKRSACCDLTLFNYYLWGAVKDKCYGDKPETIDALKNNIREAVGEIQLHTIDNVLKNWTDRVGYCIASRGSHLNEIIFDC